MCIIKAININCKINSFDFINKIQHILLTKLQSEIIEYPFNIEYNNDLGIYEIDIETTKYFDKICENIKVYNNLEFTNYILKMIFNIDIGKGYISKDTDIKSGETYYYLNMPYKNYIEYINRKKYY